jgi:hypothetical protein
VHLGQYPALSDPEDVAQVAILEWSQQRKAAPEQYAKRCALSALRKHKRRRTEPDTDATAAAGSTSPEEAIVAGIDAEGLQAIPPRTRGAGKGRFKDESKLRQAVQQKCEKEFKAALGLQWNPKWGRTVLSTDDEFRERELAERWFEQMKASMHRMVRLLGRKRLGVPILHGFDWFINDHIEPLTKFAIMTPRVGGVGRARIGVHSTARMRFVHKWSQLDFLGLKREDGRGSRVLNARELTFVWLLSGGWPNRLTFGAKGLTAAEVVRTEERAFRQAVARFDAGEHFPLLRGPG